jgi:hypothetical protein
MQGVNQEDGQIPLSISKYSTTSQTTAIAVGISLPQNILGQIDEDRGDVSRSRFLLRIIERVYNTNSYQYERNTLAKEYTDVRGAGK